MRHAKSSWNQADLNDHERPLNERGFRVASQWGEFIQEKSWTPDLIIGSTAKRVIQTIEMMSQAWPALPTIVHDELLYLATSETIVRFIRNFDPNLNTVMLVGHNPGMEFLISSLRHEETHVPTATLVRLEINCKFSDFDISQDHYRVTDFLRPKEQGIL
jgi:phosphohistidine phosphatase